MTRILFLLAVATLGCGSHGASHAAEPPAPGLPELAHTESFDPPGRLHVNAPADRGEVGGVAKATRVLVYALPNGNTLEQTLGCRLREGLDWHYDIQHVAAQIRLLRTLTPEERLVLVCAEAGGLSWPTWRGSRPDGNAKIGAFVAAWRTRFGGPEARVTLAGHSGGGSFIFGVIEAADSIPEYIDRIAILDANYAFDDGKHAAKLVRWLKEDDARRLIVLAYDDREITYEGKKVVGPDGGTFRATNRMVAALGRDFPFTKTEAAPFIEYVALDGRIHFYVHANPANKILHTALVGEMNGLVHAQMLGASREPTWGKFGGPRAYEKWIQSEPLIAESSGPPPARGEAQAARATPQGKPLSTIPARPANALGGRAFAESLAHLDRREREVAIAAEIIRGNIPNFLRAFKQVPVAVKLANQPPLSGVIEVAPDYLAVGSDEDFVRMPMTPQTAQLIANAFGCTLPTRKLVDAIDAAAEVRLAPQPLTEDRESIAAFLLSNDKIEAQRAGQPLGALTIGAKKDVVLSPLIHQRSNRVAIYGWRQLNGEPIQPLTDVHVNWYVDYSHGVRLVRDAMLVDGQPASLVALLSDKQRCALVSDEGPIDPPRYPTPESGDRQ